MKDYGDPALEALANGTAIVSGALAIYCDPPVFVWGGVGNIVIDGDTYVGVDDRAIGQVTGGSIGGAEQNVTISLSGINPETLEVLDAAEVNKAPAKLYRMIFDGSGRTMLDCRVFKRGRVDDVTVDEVIGAKASITISIESAARGLGRSGKRMRSDADQRLIDVNDGFFKHVSYAPSKTIYFGGKKSSATGGA
ncbi:hypothetical protein [Sphingobium yanoikuyae]|uniref:hypothetical protein n=1 Tax=Sphingobium yanoikuyae TaxID=13690 RepID=UPI0013776E62|nr:hypothetical protein [Sphingobium yanoikuyae]NBB37639.1 hypothetical protein [Sphingobium yanoikuyae]